MDAKYDRRRPRNPAATLVALQQPVFQAFPKATTLLGGRRGTTRRAPDGCFAETRPLDAGRIAPISGSHSGLHSAPLDPSGLTPALEHARKEPPMIWCGAHQPPRSRYRPLLAHTAVREHILEFLHTRLLASPLQYRHSPINHVKHAHHTVPSSNSNLATCMRDFALRPQAPIQT